MIGERVLFESVSPLTEFFFPNLEACCLGSAFASDLTGGLSARFFNHSFILSLLFRLPISTRNYLVYFFIYIYLQMAFVSSSSSYKLAVVGSSHLVDSEPVYDVLDAHVFLNGKPEVVVTGDCKTGIDLMVKKWCKRNNIKNIRYALKSNNKIGHQDRVNDILHASTVLIAFPMHRRSFHVHKIIQQAKSSEYRPRIIKAIFVHAQSLPKNSKRARSCSPIREVDEKERQLKFSGSYITSRKAAAAPTSPSNKENEPEQQQQQQQA
jgi:hypothetical protein